MRAIVPDLKRLLAADRDETVALRDLWALYVSGGLDDRAAMELLDHPVPGVRRWTIRLLGDDHRMNADFRRKLAELAATEPDAMVRSQIASSGQRWEAADALPILGRLARRGEDIGDPHIPNLLWWAFERQLRQDRDAVVELLCTSEMQRAPLVERHLLDRVARALVSEGSDDDFAACARLLAAAPSKEQTGRLLDGMEQGLRGRTLAQRAGADGGTTVAAVGGGAAGAGPVIDPAGGPDGQPGCGRRGGRPGPRPAGRRIDPRGDDRAARPARAGRRLALARRPPRARGQPDDPARRGRRAWGAMRRRRRLGRCWSAIVPPRRPSGADPGIALHAPGVGRRSWTRSSIGGSPPRT